MSIPIANIIAALRDTAAKVNEAVTDEHMKTYMDEYGRMKETTEHYSTERYSKDWIAGRLIGMADILEAVGME